MDDSIKKELQSAAFERLIQHLRERKDVQNIRFNEFGGIFAEIVYPNGIAKKHQKGINISDPEARKHVYGMPYDEWKQKYQK